MSYLCGLLGLSKQAYYKVDTNRIMESDLKEQMVLDYAKRIREVDGGIGLTKLWRMYAREHSKEWRMGRDHFVGLLREHGLSLRKRQHRVRTTDSRHGLPVYPNLVRELIVNAPNQVWVSDITYLEKGSGDEGNNPFYYLAMVTDLYTHEIVGWDLSRCLSKEGALRALDKAFRRLNGKEHSLIHHSDRGVQYASMEYVRRLRNKGIRISMNEKSDPKENAVAERVNGIIKNELLKGKELGSFEQVRELLSNAVRFYNQERPHMSCGMHTPLEAASMSGRLPKMWHSYREKAIEKAVCSDAAIS